MSNSTLKGKKLLFLYTEPAGYFLACIRALKQQHGPQIMVIKYPVNREAPFSFAFGEDIDIVNRENFTSAELLAKARSFDPDFIYCSGWIDNDYLEICRKIKKKIPKVLAFDNKWRGSFRQYAASCAAPFFLRMFTHAWIPGTGQESYAGKLGFATGEISQGVYSADTAIFNEVFERTFSRKKQSYPHVFVYAGRYNKVKGLEELWEAFISLCENKAHDWELWCAGTGPLQERFPVHEKIKNLGFVQPDGLAELASKAGAFVFPSRFEPWGVAVHEFAAAGLPLILSDEVGSAEAFLKHGENGFIFKNGNAAELKDTLLKVITSSDDTLSGMSAMSHELSKKISVEKWGERVVGLLSPDSGSYRERKD